MLNCPLLHFCPSRVFCPIVSCGARLKSLEEFEDHYNARHTAACSVCSRVYPTSRLLSIHVSESHDSFFQAKVARGFAMVIYFSLTLLNYLWTQQLSHSSCLSVYLEQVLNLASCGGCLINCHSVYLSCSNGFYLE